MTRPLVTSKEPEGSFPHDFSDLYEQYHQMVRRILSRLVSGNDLDDAVQETFSKIYFAKDKFNGESKVSSWIYRIALNTARDFHRKTYSWLSLKEKISFYKLKETNSEDRSDQANKCQKLIAKLDPKYKDLLVLYYLEGQTVGEISEILKVAEGTVKSRLFTARKKLSDIVKESPDER